MSIDITNHLIPYTTVKQMLATAWDEGYNEGALIGYSPMADNTPNPYRDN